MVGFFQGDVLLRSCLVPCSVGQGQIWLWFQDQTVFLSLALSSLLALVSGPGHISLTGSGSRAKQSLFGSDFRAKVFLSLAQISWPGWVSLAPLPYSYVLR